MNLFAIDNDPTQAAKWHVDSHVRKMVIEAAQILSTTFQLQNIEAPYRKTHQNHPSTIWTRTSIDNFLWTLEYGYGLGNEFFERYGKNHKSVEVIKWCEENMWRLSFDSADLTPFALAMPDEYKVADPIQSYRNYYKFGKTNLHFWKQNKPHWIDD